MNLADREDWFDRVERQAQELCARPRGTDGDVAVRMGSYLVAFIALAKTEGLPFEEQMVLFESLFRRVKPVDARGAASA